MNIQYIHSSIFFLWRCAALIAITGLLTACSEQGFSSEKPFAVMVDKSRYYPDILETIERLDRMGLAAYPICYDVKNEGLWYVAMVGADASMQKMMAKKIECEDDYRIKEATLVNYNKTKKEVVPFEPKEAEKCMAETKKPDFSPVWEDILDFVPYHKYMQVNSLLLFNGENGEDLSKISALKEYTNDLPRGIGLSDLLKKSLYFAEITYQDRLTQHIVTLHVVKFKQNTYTENQDVASLYAENILKSGNYFLEEKTPIALDGFDDLVGYQIDITGHKEKKKVYYVLTDEEKQYLILAQEINNNLAIMNHIVQSVGETEGIGKYRTVKNTLYTLPLKPTADEQLIAIKVELMKNLTGTWGARLEGAIKSNATFYQATKGSWQSEAYIIPDERNLALMFKEKYSSEKIKKKAVKIGENNGWIAYSRTKNKQTNQITDSPEELQLLTPVQIYVFSNKRRIALSEEQLKEQASRFQLFGQKVKEKNGLFGLY